jgi:hypothetical protein
MVWGKYGASVTESIKHECKTIEDFIGIITQVVKFLYDEDENENENSVRHEFEEKLFKKIIFQM